MHRDNRQAANLSNGRLTPKTFLLLALAALPVTAQAQTEAQTKAQAEAPAKAQTNNVVAATNAFLNTLKPDQRAKTLYAFTPQKTSSPAVFHGKTLPDGRVVGPPGGFVGERYGEAVWSNFPVSDVPRPGLPLGAMTAAQRTAAMHILQVLLSPMGYQKVRDIMAADQALHDGGTNFASGEDVFTVAIFGNPGVQKYWMFEFNGHHMGLNVVIAGPHGVMTPTLTGTQPALYTKNGKTIRVLAAENDKGFAVLDSLDDAQRKQAILNYAVDDLVQGPGHDGQTILPEGLKVSAMKPAQKALLMDVITEWAGIVNDAYAAPRLAEIKAGLDDTYFAWSGPTTHQPGHNGKSYYRIQGPKLLIEFSPQATNGDSTLHVHTIYRDPTNEYGQLYTNKK